MTENQLETYVKERFDMGLHEFMKGKVEKESLYDYEIAGILNVNVAQIGKLRSSLGIKRANGFARRFDLKYGAGALNTFKTMIENRDVSLSSLARHFGFSRQYASLVFKEIYGCQYRDIYKKKGLASKKTPNQERKYK